MQGQENTSCLQEVAMIYAAETQPLQVKLARKSWACPGLQHRGHEWLGTRSWLADPTWFSMHVPYVFFSYFSWFSFWFCHMFIYFLHSPDHLYDHNSLRTEIPGRVRHFSRWSRSLGITVVFSQAMFASGELTVHYGKSITMGIHQLYLTMAMASKSFFFYFTRV